MHHTKQHAIVYQGQEQHFSGGVDPYNREAVWLSGYPTHSDLYKAVKNLNLIRSAASNQSSTFLTSKMNAVYTDANTIAFRKGDDDLSLLTVVSNLGKDSKDRKVKIPAAGFAANAKVTDVINCKSVKADSDGGIEVKIKSGKPMVRTTGCCEDDRISANVLAPRSSIRGHYWRARICARA